MMMEVFSVFDKQIGAYMVPFFVRTKGEAIRSFTEAVNDPQKPFGKYANDYGLYVLGTYDDNTGMVLSHDPVRVIGAHEVLTSDEVFSPETRRS